MGGSFQKRDRGGWHRGENDGGLHRSQSGTCRDGEGPGDYRWSSYGEAIGGGSKGTGKTARAGLVRALRAHQGGDGDWNRWEGEVAREYRKILVEGSMEKLSKTVGRKGKIAVKTTRKGISAEVAGQERENDGVITLGKMLHCRIRYFTDGAVIGSRLFVNEAFASSRLRSGSKRKSGARKLRGDASPLAGTLFSFRELRKGILA